MAKLVEILARELKEWPENASEIGQWPGGEIAIRSIFVGAAAKIIYTSNTLAVDKEDAWCTRPQWEAERDRIATNQQSTQEAREIEKAGTMTNEDQELAAIACGKRSAEEQALWDKVAIAAMNGLISCDAFHGYLYQQNPENAAIFGADCADAFMAERAKRMENNQ